LCRFSPRIQSTVKDAFPGCHFPPLYPQASPLRPLLLPFPSAPAHRDNLRGKSPCFSPLPPHLEGTIVLWSFFFPLFPENLVQHIQGVNVLPPLTFLSFKSDPFFEFSSPPLCPTMSTLFFSSTFPFGWALLFLLWRGFFFWFFFFFFHCEISLLVRLLRPGLTIYQTPFFWSRFSSRRFVAPSILPCI